jgi:DNA polymerase-3 subunit gamma/tau
MQDVATALYRKYRPSTFKEVLSQEHVVSVLQKAVSEKSVPHALLFAGTRGTGKTSIARIFAREIGAKTEDVYEIDAASNRGVDDVRALREDVHTLPFVSPYKVYIIDEVHMLTKEAFNALLKTLEEPPQHVVFVLATTELEKLPDTIVSRCQLHVFKTPSVSVLKDMLKQVAKKEGYTLAPGSADVIALLADGSFRDAHGALQKAMAQSKDTTIEADEVSAGLGVPTSSMLQDFVTALAVRDAEAGLTALEKARAGSVTQTSFNLLLLRLVRAIILARVSAGYRESLKDSMSDEEQAFVTKHAQESAAVLNSHLLRTMLQLHNQTHISSLPLLTLELLVVETCTDHENK